MQFYYVNLLCANEPVKAGAPTNVAVVGQHSTYADISGPTGVLQCSEKPTSEALGLAAG